MPLRPKSKAKEADAFYWHADFRRVDALPDVKVVRTKFFVNFMAVAAPLLLAVWVANNELEAGNLRSEIAALEDSVAAARPRNAEAVKLDQAFAKERGKVHAFTSFYKPAIEPLELLAIFSESRPEGLIFDRLSLTQRRETTRKGKKVIETLVPVVQIVGELEGDASEALAVLKAYEQQLLEIEEIKDRIENFDAAPTRSSDNDSFRFKISMDLPKAK
ncbi:MAG: hypothetical protein ACFB20_12365 [Opitutales bacterium]